MTKAYERLLKCYQCFKDKINFKLVRWHWCWDPDSMIMQIPFGRSCFELS